MPLAQSLAVLLLLSVSPSLAQETADDLPIRVDKDKLSQLAAPEGSQAGKDARALCPDLVDLRSGFPPVRHQGETQWCYAYAASDLLSYRDGRALSAVDVAMLYNSEVYGTDQPQTSRERGWTDKALTIALQRDVCLEEDAPSRMMSDGVNRLLSTYKEIERIADDAMRRYGSVTGAFDQANKYFFERENGAAEPPPYPGSVCESEWTQGLRPGRIGQDDFVIGAANRACLEGYPKAAAAFPRLTRRALFEALRTRSRNHLLRALTDASCRRVKVHGAEPGAVRTTAGGETGFESVAAQLNARNPVAVIYNPDALNGPAEQSTTHASVLAGLRWNGRTCELLVRDSYGQDGLWIPAAQLMHAVSSVQYLAR